MTNTIPMLERIICNTPGYIFWKDENLTYRGCNNNFAKIIGYASPEDIIGKTDAELPWEEGSEKVYVEEDNYVLSTGNVISEKEVRMVTKFTGERILSVSKSPLYDESGKKIIGILGIYSDITEKKWAENALLEAKERAESLSAAKTELIENMSHDLRTPMTGLVTISDAQLLSLSDADPFKEIFSLISDSANQLHRLFEQILESAKLDHKNQPDDLEVKKEFSPKEMINSIVDLYKPSLVGKNLEYSIEKINNIEDRKAKGYPLMIEKVLLNLVGNAIKFTKSGKVSIEYGLSDSIMEAETAYDHLCLIIRDTGCGIPLDEQETIFNPLHKISPSYKGLFQGTGLGLYITKKLVALMNGTINVKSEGKGRGSVFTCLIPVDKVDEEVNVCREQERVDSTMPITNQETRLLLVEDSRMARMAAKMYLEKYNATCQIDEADCATKAKEMAEKNQYHIVIMDVGLPDGDGRDVTEWIRENELSKNKDAPIVALTGHIDNDTRSSCIDAGMNEVLRKPLDDKQIERLFSFLKK